MVRCSTLLLILAATAAATGYVSVAPWLDPLPRALLPAALLWLLYRRGRGGVIPSRPALMLAMALFIYFLAAMPRQGIVGPSIGLMASLLALRLISEKSGRHYLQICALAIFLLAASSLHSLSPLFIAYLSLLMLLVTMLLLLLSFSQYGDDIILDRHLVKRLGTATVVMNLAAVPLLVLLFMILPRTQVPLWRFGAPAESARVGFSESVRPGTVASVSAERTPVFRAEMPKVASGRLYWRGTVLNRAEGNAWTRVTPPPVRLQGGAPDAGTIQSVQLEPGSGAFLFALDLPRTVRRIRATVEADGVAQLPAPAAGRVSYQVLSVERSLVVEEQPDFYLQLPDRLSPRLRNMAEQLRQAAPIASERPDLLAERFRQLGLRYAVEGLPTTTDPIDTFLFDSKRGNCEFFAASYALLLRAAGIPSRLVGGYYGGTYNDVGGYYLVTQDMAHTWVEYYLEGTGWQRVDPTMLGEGFSRLVEARSRGGWLSLRLYADTLAFFWNGRVIPFDFESQYGGYRRSTDLIGRMFRTTRAVRPVPMMGYALIALLVVPSVLLVRQRLTPRGRLQRLLHRFERRLKRQYPNLPPLARSGVFGLANASGSETARRFATLYGRIVYGNVPLSRQIIGELEQLLKEL